MSKPKPLYELVEEFRRRHDIHEKCGISGNYKTCADELEISLMAWHEYLWAEESSDLQAGDVREDILGTENFVRQNLQP